MSRYKLIKIPRETACRPPNRIPIDTSTWKEMEWFTTATAVQTNRMKDFLLNLDKAKRVDLNSERGKTIRQEMYQIMSSICLKIEQLDPRFAGRLIRMGSAHNDMKLGDSDEFDFVYELVMSVAFKGKYNSSSFPEDNTIDLVVDDQRFNEPLSRLGNSLGNAATYYGRTGNYTDDSDSETTEEYDTGHSGAAPLLDEFRLDLGLSMAHIVHKAMLSLVLPPAWSHGGFNRPQYSGLRKSGPALMLQFDYLGTGDQIPLRISVDFVPLSTLPLSVLEDKRMDVLNEFLLKKGFLAQFWASCITDTLMYFSQGEEEWLRQYSADSVAKTAVRCCKALISSVSQSAPKCPSRSTVLQVIEYLNQKAEGNNNAELPDIPEASMLSETVVEDIHVPMSVNDKLVTYSDLGEAGGQFEYLKSYLFKRTVMTLMALDDDEGRNWTDDDLPDLVMSVYMIIHALIKPDQNEEEFHIEKLSVPLAGMYVTSDEPTAGSMTETSKPQDEDPFGDINVAPPKFYSMMSSALKEGRCMSLVELSSHILEQEMFLRSGRKYAGCLQVCQLLQSVCEGKETAEIDVFIPTVQESDHASQYIYEEYMTKTEYGKMLEERQCVKGGVNFCNSALQLDLTERQFQGINLDETSVQKHGRSPRSAAGRGKSLHWKGPGKTRTRTPKPNDVTEQSLKTTIGDSKPHLGDQASNVEITPGQVQGQQPKEISGRIKELHPKTVAWQSRRLHPDTTQDRNVAVEEPLAHGSKQAADRGIFHNPKTNTRKEHDK